jgi:hypothetical protein
MASSYCYWILFLLEWNDYSMVAAKQTMSVCLPIVYFYPSMFTAVMRRSFNAFDSFQTISRILLVWPANEFK